MKLGIYIVAIHFHEWGQSYFYILQAYQALNICFKLLVPIGIRDNIEMQQAKDASEYMEYIEFLQNQKLIKPGVEQLDLEELQGVVGLKALRVDVNFITDAKPAEQKIELSNITTQQLIGK